MMEDDEPIKSDYETAASGPQAPSPSPSLSSPRSFSADVISDVISDVIDERTTSTFTLGGDTPENTPRLRSSANRQVQPQKDDLGDSTVCPECGKELSSRHILDRHRRAVHHLGRQYYCKDCGNRRFGRLDHWRMHLLKHHKKVVEPTYTRNTRSHKKTYSPSARPKETSTSASTSNSSPVMTSTSGTTQETQASAGNLHSLAPPPPPPAVSSSAGAKATRTNPTPDTGTITLASLEACDRGLLISLIGAKIHECDELRKDYEKLQKECKTARMERDEYLEALKMSEDMRARLQA